MSPSRPPVPRPAPTRRAPTAAKPATPESRSTAKPAAPDSRCAPTSAAHSQAHPTRGSAPQADPRTSRGATGAGAGTPAAPATAPAGVTAATTYEVRRFRGPVRPAVVSTRSAERFAERARAARNLARRQVALVVAGVLVVAGLGYLVLFSPVFRLDPERVAVTGAGTVVAVDQVDAVVARHAGTPLPRLDTGAVREEVLQVPGVREASVTRDWPTGLTVALVSREPVAAVPEAQAPEGAAGPGFTLLDEEGVPVGRSDAPPDGLPVVGVPAEQPRTLAAVLAVVRSLPDDLVAQVADVSAQTQDTIAMTLRDGVRVEWGSDDETALKATVLKTLRASPAAAGATVIDVSAPRLPITR